MPCHTACSHALLLWFSQAARGYSSRRGAAGSPEPGDSSCWDVCHPLGKAGQLDWGDTKSSLLPAPRICDPLQMPGSPSPRCWRVASAPRTLPAPASLVLSPPLKPAASFLPSCCSSAVVRVHKTNKPNKMHLQLRAFVIVIWISLCWRLHS